MYTINQKYKKIVVMIILYFLLPSCSFLKFEGLERFETNDVLSFSFDTTQNPNLHSKVIGSVSSDKVYLNVPLGTDITSLVPSISINGDTIEPSSGIAQNFNSSVTYTIKALAGKTKSYQVVVTSTFNSQNAFALYHTFNNNFNDNSSNGYTQIEFGDVTYTNNRSGAANNAAHFSTANDYLELNFDDTTSLAYTSEFSISTWINFSDVTAWQAILGQNGPGAAYYLQVFNKKLVFELYNQGNPDNIMDNDTSIELTANQWIHLGVSWKTGGKLRAYINGNLAIEKDALTGPSVLTGAKSFIIGGMPGNPTTFSVLNGSIDDVRIYNTELTPNEMTALAALPAD